MGARAAVAIAAAVLCSCGSTREGALIATPSPTHGAPATSARLNIPLLGLRLVYRTYDQTSGSYGLAAANADGRNRVPLSGPNFAHPEMIRFVQSSNRRWTAWVDGGINGGDLRVAASARLPSATTVFTETSKILEALAVSDDGDTVAYELLTEVGPESFTADLYLAHVHDRSTAFLRALHGPPITCVGYGVFDVTATRLLTVGCAAGMAHGLFIFSTADGAIVSEDEAFLAWPGQWAFSADLGTAWMIVGGATENDLVRYDVATRARDVVFRAQTWQQPAALAGLNLGGPVLLAPDGADLAFSGITSDRQRAVYLLPSGGGGATEIFQGDSSTGLVSWTPDGVELVVSGGGSTRLRLVDRRTRDVTPVVTEAAFDQFLAWVVP